MVRPCHSSHSSQLPHPHSSIRNISGNVGQFTNKLKEHDRLNRQTRSMLHSGGRSMRIKSQGRWCYGLVAMLAISWTGCATTGGSPFSLASHRNAPPQGQATPSQLAAPGPADAPPAGGYQAQFVSNQTPRPQQRYTKPNCNTGVG